MSAPQTAQWFIAYVASGDAGVDLAGQRTSIARHAESKNLTADAEFCDDGVTGDAGLRDRPQLADMLVAIAAGQVRTVVVHSLERLSQDPVQREVVLHELRRAGVTVEAAESDAAESADANTALVQRVLAAMADFDGHPGVIALREAAKNDNGAAGDEARAEILRLRAERVSFAAIARKLNKKGLLDPEGRPWTRMSVFEFQR